MKERGAFWKMTRGACKKENKLKRKRSEEEEGKPRTKFIRDNDLQENHMLVILPSIVILASLGDFVLV